MKDRAQYPIDEARQLLGGISRNSIYALFRSGKLASVVIGCRRCVSQEAISELIAKSTTIQSPTEDPTRKAERFWAHEMDEPDPTGVCPTTHDAFGRNRGVPILRPALRHSHHCHR